MPVAPSTTAELLDLIRRSGIASPTQLATAAELPDDPRVAISILVHKGVVTRFQAQQLMQGRHKGFRLGQHIILDQIGRGGMGAVYLAEHQELHRKVAIKVLVIGKDDDARLAAERFLREARAAAALDHPNIVRIFDVSRHNDVPYLVMEYVEGETLQQILDRDGAMPYGAAADAVAQAAAGLQHAHEKGFVHRDIKPGNLMRERTGTVKILDMGLARAQGNPADRLTEQLDAGAVVGTADFIAPEQAMNDAPIDVRADIYSLGATFFALVTGAPPFQGNTAQKLLQHQMKSAPHLSSIDATLPRGLAGVVAKMLAKRPADRYQTPAEMISALTPWLGNSTRVLAGLSRTNLALGVELHEKLKDRTGSSVRLPHSAMGEDATPDPAEVNPSSAAVETGEVATSPTDRAPSTPRRSRGLDIPPKKRGSKAIVFAVIGLAVLLVAGGVGVWLLIGGKDSPTQSAADTTGSTAQATPQASPTTAPNSQPTPPPQVAPTAPQSFAFSGGPFIPIPLDTFATATSAKPLFYTRQNECFLLPSWEPREVLGVRFHLADPMSGTVKNVIMLRSEITGAGIGPQPAAAPDSVTIPVNQNVAALHFLGGVGGWVWPWRPPGAAVDSLKGKVAMTVRVRHADGVVEEFPWRQGEHIADWLKRSEVPGSKFAFEDVVGHQVRYLKVQLARPAAVREVELIRGETKEACPLVFALTVEIPSGGLAGNPEGVKKPTIVAQLDLSKTQPFSIRSGLAIRDDKQKVAKILSQTGPGAPPKGWSARCWHAETEIEFAADTAEGSPAMSLRNLRGPGSAMLFTPPFTCPGGACRLRIEYAAAVRPRLFTVKFKSDDDRIAWEVSRPPGGRDWRTEEYAVDMKGAKGGYFEFHNSDPSPSASLRLRAMVVTEIAGNPTTKVDVAAPATPIAIDYNTWKDGTVVYQLDVAAIEPFRVQKEQYKRIGGDPEKLPPGVSCLCWKAEATGEFRRETVGDVPALGVTNLSDLQSAQYGFNIEQSKPTELIPGKTYRARLTYSTRNEAQGAFSVQSTDYKTLGRTNLPTTGGEWKTVSLVFERKEGVPIRFTVDNTSVGEGNTLDIRSLEVVELEKPN